MFPGAFPAFYNTLVDFHKEHRIQEENRLLFTGISNIDMACRCMTFDLNQQNWTIERGKVLPISNTFVNVLEAVMNRRTGPRKTIKTLANQKVSEKETALTKDKDFKGGGLGWFGIESPSD